MNMIEFLNKIETKIKSTETGSLLSIFSKRGANKTIMQLVIAKDNNNINYNTFIKEVSKLLLLEITKYNDLPSQIETGTSMVFYYNLMDYIEDINEEFKKSYSSDIIDRVEEKLVKRYNFMKEKVNTNGI